MLLFSDFQLHLPIKLLTSLRFHLFRRSFCYTSDWMHSVDLFIATIVPSGFYHIISRCFWQSMVKGTRYLERMPVILSAAKDLARRAQGSFAALRMTGRTPLKPAHGKSSLHMSVRALRHLSFDNASSLCYPLHGIKGHYQPAHTKM